MEISMKKYQGKEAPQEVSFYEIYLNEKGEKEFHFLGYTYCGDHWECADVCWFMIPLSEFVKNMEEDDNYVNEMLGEYKQYIKDCSEDEIVYITNHYFDGKGADSVLPFENITNDTPCGNYIC